MNPTVSVLMTSYNREKYIAEAIESLLASTYKDFELIIVDDCSTDKTIEIAKRYADKDERIQIVINETNLGQFANRNKAMTLAQGTYIKFLDSDDILFPYAIEIMVNAMLTYPDAGIGLPITENISNKILPFKMLPRDTIFNHYAGAGYLNYGPTASIFRKDVVVGKMFFENEYGILADILLNIKLASEVPTVFFQRDLFYWRIHSEQITEGQKKLLQMIIERYDIFKAAITYKNSPLTQSDKQIIKNKYKKIYFNHIFRYLLKFRFLDAFKIYNNTIKTF